MSWVVLVLAGLFEIGWPVGFKMGWSEQGIRPGPLIMAVLCMAISGALLFLAQRQIPIGTAYAVWTGMGAIGTFVAGVWLFAEPANAARIACVGLVAAGIVGLKLFG